MDYKLFWKNGNVFVSAKNLSIAEIDAYTRLEHKNIMHAESFINDECVLPFSHKQVKFDSLSDTQQSDIIDALKFISQNGYKLCKLDNNIVVINDVPIICNITKEGFDYPNLLHLISGRSVSGTTKHVTYNPLPNQRDVFKIIVEWFIVNSGHVQLEVLLLALDISARLLGVVQADNNVASAIALAEKYFGIVLNNKLKSNVDLRYIVNGLGGVINNNPVYLYAEDLAQLKQGYQDLIMSKTIVYGKIDAQTYYKDLKVRNGVQKAITIKDFFAR